MKNIMIVNILILLFSGTMVHGMLRRNGARVFPSTTTLHGVDTIYGMQKPLFSRVAQTVGAKAEAASQGFSAKIVNARVAAAAKNEAWRKAFAATRSRAGQAMRSLQIPAAALGGAAVGAAGMYPLTDLAGRDDLERQILTMNEMIPEVGNVQQESLWRSMFDVLYAKWLKMLSREKLEIEYASIVEKLLAVENDIFYEDQVNRLMQHSGKIYWSSPYTKKKESAEFSKKRDQYVESHKEQQRRIRHELQNLASLSGQELTERLREIKPQYLLKKHKYQEESKDQEKSFLQTNFPSALEKVDRFYKSYLL